MRIIIESDERSGTYVTQPQPTTQPVSTAPLSAGPPAASLLEGDGSQVTNVSSPQQGDATNAGPPSPALVSAIQTTASAQTSFAGTGVDRAGVDRAGDGGSPPVN